MYNMKGELNTQNSFLNSKSNNHKQMLMISSEYQLAAPATLSTGQARPPYSGCPGQVLCCIFKELAEFGVEVTVTL